MARKAQLEEYLAKVAGGDRSYLDRLCRKLSDREVFVAVRSDGVIGADAARFTLAFLINGNKSLLPVFTTKIGFKKWSGAPSATKPLAMLCGEVCAALPEKTGIIINPDSKDTVELNPVMVRLVAASLGAG